jgi:hypothetical protein
VLHWLNHKLSNFAALRAIVEIDLSERESVEPPHGYGRD